MDGGGRLLRSLSGLTGALAGSPPAAAPLAVGAGLDPFAFPVLPQTAPQLPRGRRRRRRPVIGRGLERLVASRLFGTALVVALITAVGAYGAVRGGQYDALCAAQGTLPDILARALGFPIKAVTITGARELTEGEILKLAGVGPRNSLLFLDVAAVRARLKAVPLIKEASVSKLYPNRLLVEVEERQPAALWQKDGVVAIVAADGTPIDDMQDPRFERCRSSSARAPTPTSRNTSPSWTPAATFANASAPASTSPGGAGRSRRSAVSRSPCRSATRPRPSRGWARWSTRVASWRRTSCRSTFASPAAWWRGCPPTPPPPAPTCSRRNRRRKAPQHEFGHHAPAHAPAVGPS